MSPVRTSERIRYPANWQAISARIRFVRAAGRCECEGESGPGMPAGSLRATSAASGDGLAVVLTTAQLVHVPEHGGEANPRRVRGEAVAHTLLAGIYMVHD